VLGHSMGGLVASCVAALGQVRIDGLVLSSPLFDPRLSTLQRLLLATVPRVAPDLRVHNGVDPDLISRDPQVVAAYRSDALVHNRISARLARFISDAGPMVIEHAPQWTVPTLLMYAGSDRLVNPAGAEAFAQAAPPQLVTTHCFAGHYHEIFNEPDKEPVFNALRLWLDSHFREY
jgi:alpha-beta hydrolase superfamily lysophospholipase